MYWLIAILFHQWYIFVCTGMKCTEGIVLLTFEMGVKTMNVKYALCLQKRNDSLLELHCILNEFTL